MCLLSHECKFQGLALLDSCLVIWGHQSWVVYNMAGQEKGRRELPEGRSIRALRLETVERARIVSWSGDPDNPDLALQSVAEEGWGPPLSLHTAFALSASLNLAFLCENTEDFTISSHRYHSYSLLYQQTIFDSENWSKIIFKSKPCPMNQVEQ